jgi:predicted dehydrogenase
MAPVRLAVIGVGHLGRHHARILRTLPGVQFVAAADLVRARADAAVAGSDVRAVGDARELVGAVDAVVVAVPTVAHLSVARPFLEAGVHVLVEKPMAACMKDADTFLRLAAQQGCVLAVGHSERFNPAVAAAWPLITAPRFIEVHRLSTFPERSLDVDVIFDVMIHDLDIIRAIDTSEVVDVQALGIPVLTPRVDIANVRLRFASGCVANLTASRISREQVRKIRFFQADSYVSIDYAAQEVEAWRLVPQGTDRPKIEGGRVPVSGEEPLVLELTDFVAAIREGRRPTVSGEDGREALALATRIAETIAHGSGT